MWESNGTFLKSIQQSYPSGLSSTPAWVNPQVDNELTFVATTKYIIGIVTDTSSSILDVWDDNLGGTGNGHGSVAGTVGNLGDLTPPSYSSTGNYTFVLYNSSGDPS